MELKLQNSRQCLIADLLWAAEFEEQVDEIIDQFGEEAELVYELMIVTAFDEVNDLGEAAEVIKRISR